jgi:hypothetical protein
MTLAAILSFEQCPIIIGDLLLSGDESTSGDRIGIPAHSDITDVFPKGSGYSITGMSQKVILISDKCVLAWAGSKVAASVVVGDFVSMASNKTLSLASILEYINKKDDHIGSLPLSIVGWVLDGNECFPFFMDAENASLPPYEHTYVIGSGKQALLDVIGGLEAVPVAKGSDPYREAVVRAMSLLGLFYQVELNTQTNLLHFWGGGYEIALIIDGSFKKLDDVTFVFWRADVSSDKIKIMSPHFILKQKYFEDELVIRSAKIIESSGTRISADDNSYLVLPVQKNKATNKKVDCKPLELNSEYTIHMFIISQPSPQVFVRLERCLSGASTGIVFSTDAEKISLSVNEDFIKNISNSLRKGFRQ